MTHFTLLVVLDGGEVGGRTLESLLEEALRPFDENRETEPRREYIENWPAELERAKDYYTGKGAGREIPDLEDPLAVFRSWKGGDVYSDTIDGGAVYYTMTTYNPDSKWDFWGIGGRWGDYFVPAANARPEDLIRGEWSWEKKFHGHLPNPYRCDGGRRGSLDFEALRGEQGKKAAGRYDTYHRMVEGLPEAKPWKDYLARRESESDYTIDRARQDYNAQSRVERFKRYQMERRELSLGCAVAEFGVPREDYIADARRRAVPGYALLTLDGSWVAPGEMGWFGISSDTEANRELYWERANRYLDELDKDAWVVCLDLHI